MLACRLSRPKIALFASGLALAAACAAPPSAKEASGTGGGSALFGQGGGPTTVCEPGSASSCYDGPEGTLGLGACRDGLKTCLADGSGFGACEGQILPAAKENCDTPVDDDCNGQTTEGCGCKPGSTASCYDGPSGTEGIGLCKGGTQTCNADGSGYGACTGQVLPSDEDCATPADEDCNGSGACASGGALVSKFFGGAGDEVALGVAIDPSGQVVVVGRFQGTVDFGGGPLTSAGGDDIFVARYLSNGAFVWAKRFGDAADQRANAVAVDAAGNTFVVGGFDGALDFGKNALTSAGGGDGFISCFDKSGNHRWARSFGDADSQEALAVTADATGDVTVTGRFAGSANFGGGELTSAGGDDLFVARFDVGGAFGWAKAFGDAGAQQGLGVAADAKGDVWVTGSAAGTVDFGGGPLSAQGDDAFVLELGANGQHLISHLYGGVEAQAGRAIAVDAANAPVLAGFTMGPLDLGTGHLPCGMGAGLFLARLDADGATTSAACFGTTTPSMLEPVSVAFDTSGAVLVGGAFRDAIDVGLGPLTSAGGADVFFARFDPKLAPVQALRFGDAEDQACRAVAGDFQGNFWLAGGFAGSIDLSAKLTSSAGGDDVFLAKLGP